jgi:hypothetical protein
VLRETTSRGLCVLFDVPEHEFSSSLSAWDVDFDFYHIDAQSRVLSKRACFVVSLADESANHHRKSACALSDACLCRGRREGCVPPGPRAAAHRSHESHIATAGQRRLSRRRGWRICRCQGSNPRSCCDGSGAGSGDKGWGGYGGDGHRRSCPQQDPGVRVRPRAPTPVVLPRRSWRVCTDRHAFQKVSLRGVEAACRSARLRAGRCRALAREKAAADAV